MTDAEINERVCVFHACRTDATFEAVLLALDPTLRAIASMAPPPLRADLHAVLVAEAWRRWLPGYCPGPVPARLYVARCARVYAGMWCARQRAIGEPLNGNAHSVAAREDAGAHELFAACVARMSHTQRRALELHCSGHTRAEVAQAMHTTPRMAALYLRRARTAAYEICVAQRSTRV